MSGYAIKKLIEMGLSQFWSESYGQLYPTLEKLVDEGLATKAEAPTGERKRFMYKITESGRQKFLEWLSSPTAPAQARSEFQLKLFVASDLPLDHSLSLLREYEAQQTNLYYEYKASERVLSEALDYDFEIEELQSLLGDCPRRQLLVFLINLRHGLEVVKAHLKWCRQSIELIETEIDEGLDD